MSQPEAFGEVITADSCNLEIECHRLYGAPSFGSFIRAECVGGEMSHFAVVTHVRTGPVDGNRVVQAHRLPPGELEQRKPHLNTLFRTTFQARIIGYGRGNAVLAGTAPLPPRLHCFVYPASADEIRAVTSGPDFLRPLTQVLDAPKEDLLVAAVDAARTAWGPHAPVVQWGKYLARLLRADYVTLEGVFTRIGAAGGQPYPAPTITPPAPAPAKPANGNGRKHPLWEESKPLINGTGAPRSADPFED